MKPDELLYVAFKDIVLANLKSGFLRQHISDSTYYTFDKYPELFLDVLEASKEKYSTNGMVEKFFTLNPERLKDLKLAKCIFQNLISSEDFKFMMNSFGEEVFISDLKLMREVVKNIDSHAFDNYYAFTKTRESKELREVLYDLDSFNLAWFNLPAPKDEELVLESLKKNPIGYWTLTEEQKQNKEFGLIALSHSTKGGDSSTHKIYELIPEKFKYEEDISMLAAQGGIVKQPLESFDYSNVLYAVLKSFYPNPGTRNKEQITLIIPNLDMGIFKNAHNIESFFKFMVENKECIKNDHDTYSLWYKILKGMVKHNPYIKEQFEKGGDWNVGNIGETKHNASSFFREYFEKTIPELYNQVKYFVMADQLSKNLPKKELKEIKLKI